MLNRTLISVVLILILVTTGLATAQQDVFCVCVDPDTPSTCGGNVDAPFLGHAIVWLCIVDISNFQVKAWEALVEISDESAWVGNWQLAGGNNYGTPPVFVVGAGSSPLQPNSANAVALMSIDLLILDETTPIEFYVRGVPGSLSFPDGPGYAWEAGFPVPCTPCSGDVDTPVFTINGEDPPPTQFTVRIDASDGVLHDDGNLAGTSNLATDGYDADHDVPEPPASPTDYLTLYFPHAEWSTPFGERFMTDIRADYDPSYEAKTWAFVVETDRSSIVTLDFMPYGGYSTSWGIVLHNVDEDWTIDLDLAGYILSYESTPGDPEHFELRIGPPGGYVPVPPYRLVTAGWSLIGCPLVPPFPGTVQDAVLQSASGTVFVYDHDAGAGYGLMAADDHVVQGEAMWVATTQDFVWSIPGGSLDEDGVDVPLNDGWTMLGYPLWIPTDLSALTVSRPGHGTQSWDNAVSSNWISGTAYDYITATGLYQPSSSFETWHGYWVAGMVPGLTLHFDHTSVIPPARTVERDPDEIWILEVTVDGGPDKVVFGAHALAGESFDARYDLPAAPAAPVTAASAKLRFDHPEWDLPVGSAFITDLRPPVEPPYQWNALLTAPAPGPAVLSWDGAALPPETDLQVYLPQQNRVVVMSMRDASSVTLDVGAEPLQVVFRSPDMSTGVADAPGRHEISCHPNPFNPVTEIELRTGAPGRVGLDIYDLRGRRVRAYALGEQPAGSYRVTWRGRDDDGREVAGGTYFAVLALDGARTGTLAKLTLVR